MTRQLYNITINVVKIRGKIRIEIRIAFNASADLGILTDDNSI